MSRFLRIEYENAWYCVMNRGARKRAVFNKDNERQLFLELLNQMEQEANLQAEINKIKNYCLSRHDPEN